MCEQCCAKTIYLGEIAKGFHFVKATRDGNEMKKGEYGIIRCNDPDIIFPESLKPFPDPYLNNEEDGDKFIDLVYNLREYLIGSFDFGYDFYMACSKEPDWNHEKPGNIDWWIINKMGILVSKFEKHVEEFRNNFPIDVLRQAVVIDETTKMEVDADTRFLVSEYYERLENKIKELSEALHVEYVKAKNSESISEFFNLIGMIVRESEQ